MSRFSLIILSIVISLVGCENTSECLKNGGELIKKEFDFEGDIKTLILESEVNVCLKNGEEQKVEVEFPEHFMENLDMQFEEGTLTINNKLPCKWGRDHYAPEIYATLPALTYIRMFDYSNVYSVDTLKQDKLKIYAYATGDIDLLVDMKRLRVQNDYVSDYTVSGKADEFIIYFKQSGRLFAENLMADHIKFTHTGENDIHLNPLKKIEGKLTGFGDVHLYHIPDTVNITTEAEGKVILVN